MPLSTAAHRLLVALLLAAFAWFAAKPIVLILHLANYPVDFFLGEGDFLFHAHRMLRGENIYTPSTGLPLIGNLYPPLYPWIMYAAAKLFGPSLATMRLISLIPTFGLPALVYLYVARAGAPRVLGALAALAVLALFPQSIHLINPRCDTWCALFAFAALYFLAAPAFRTRDAVLGALCAALALFAKQTALFGILALFAHVCWTHRRRALVPAAVFAGACLALAGLALLQFGSEFVHNMLFLTVRRESEAARLSSVIWPAFLPVAIFYGAAAVHMGWNLRHRTWDLIDTYLAGNAVCVTLMFFDGSGSNYLLPLLPGACVAAALATQRLLERFAFNLPAVALLALAAAGQLALQSACGESPVPPTAAEWREAERAADFLRTANEPVYAERCWGPVAGAEATDRFFVEPVHVRYLANREAAQRTVEEAFSRRTFGRVLLHYQGFHWQGFGDKVMQDYKPAGVGKVRIRSGTCFLIYLERTPAPPADP